MPITMQFDTNQPDLLVVDYTAPWTWSDFHAAYDQAKRVTEGMNAVYVIHRVRAHADSGSSTLQHYRSTLGRLPARVRVMAVVPEAGPIMNHYLDVLLGAGIKLFARGRVQIVRDEAAAHALVNARRQQTATA